MAKNKGNEKLGEDQLGIKIGDELMKRSLPPRKERIDDHLAVDELGEWRAANSPTNEITVAGLAESYRVVRDQLEQAQQGVLQSQELARALQGVVGQKDQEIKARDEKTRELIQRVQELAEGAQRTEERIRELTDKHGALTVEARELDMFKRQTTELCAQAGIPLSDPFMTLEKLGRLQLQADELRKVGAALGIPAPSQTGGFAVLEFAEKVREEAERTSGDRDLRKKFGRLVDSDPFLKKLQSPTQQLEAIGRIFEQQDTRPTLEKIKDWMRRALSRIGIG